MYSTLYAQFHSLWRIIIVCYLLDKYIYLILRMYIPHVYVALTHVAILCLYILCLDDELCMLKS